MKELINGIILTGTIIFGLTVCSQIQTTYKQEAKVINMTYDSIIVQTKNGYTYEYNGIDFYLNEPVELIMYDNHTENNLNDDVIRKIKKKK